MINFQKIKENKGFVILFAVLISSMILLVSVGIFKSIQNEVILSSTARESQRAFYAADSALECALYVDLLGVPASDGSGLGTPFTINPTGENVVSFTCANSSLTSTYLLDAAGTGSYEYPYIFRYTNGFNVEDTSCAYVLVEKELRDTNPADTAGTEVRITAVGFNLCTDATGGFSGQTLYPDFQDPTLLERRLSITYVR